MQPVQLATLRGIRVIATASADDAAYVHELGALRVIDYKNERFEDIVHSLDGVLDVVGGETRARSWSVLRPGGVLVTTVPVGSPAAESGLEEGDVIVRAGKEAVATVRDLRELVARAAADGERSVTLELRRGKDRRTLTLRWRSN